MTGRIGTLRHRLTIQLRSVVSDGAGGELVTWADGDVVWASIEPLAGDERVRRDRLFGSVTHRMTIRFRDDVSPENRFRLGDRIFEIAVVRDVDERHRWLDCLCEEKYL